MANKSDLLMKIRMFCSECMGSHNRAADNVWPISNPKEVSECPATKCVWYSYRFGQDPDKNPAKVARGKEMAKERHANKNS